MHLVLDIVPPPGQEGGFGPNAMIAQKIPAAAFADGFIAPGEISAPITLARDDEGDLHDKNSMTADPTNSNRVYAVWDFLTIPEGHQLNPERGFGNLIGFGFKSVTLFTRSLDAGASWSEPKIIYNPGGNNQTIGNQIVVGPDGTLFNFFDEILNFRNDDHGPQFDRNLSMIRSTDQGTTWLPSGRPIRIADMNSILIRDPDQPTAPRARDRHRAADLNPEVAVDPNNGNLYAVWQDARFSGFVHNDIAFTMSTDGGRTWSAPIKVNQTPASATGHNGHAFTPSVHVLPNGTIGVSHYDFRNQDPATEASETDHFIVHCHAPSGLAASGCTDEGGWSETTVTDASFDLLKAPDAGGLFLGDYVGLSNVGNSFSPFFTQSNSDADPATEYYSAVG
jgi:hypothetical protein